MFGRNTLLENAPASDTPVLLSEGSGSSSQHTTMSTRPQSRSSHCKWFTPSEVYDPLHAEFAFDDDPCPPDWQEGQASGLDRAWGRSVFCNPPYANVAPWIKHAAESAQAGSTVVMLLNVTITGTAAFHTYVVGHPVEVRFLPGRVKFIDGTKPPGSPRTSNTVPSVVLVFRPPQDVTE